MANYKLPKNWNAFNTWFTSFHKAFNSNAKNYGFSANDIKAFNQWFKNWQSTYNTWNGFNNFSKTFNQFQNFEFGFFQAMVNGYMSQIAKNKNFNGNWNTWFGTPASTTTTKKATAKKSAAKKVTAKKSTAKKSTRTSPRAKSTTKVVAKSTSKPIAKTTVKASKPAKKTTAKKSVAKKSTAIKATKPAVKKTIAKKVSKPVAKKSTTIRASKPAIKKSARTMSRSTSTKTTAVKAKVSKKGSKKPIAKSSTGANNSPFVWFTNGKSGVNVYVGSSKNGNFSLPNGTKAAYVEFKNGGNKWQKLTQGSNFPFVHSYNGNGRIYYRACWINSNGKKGSFSKPVSMTNSSKATAPKAAA